MPVRPGQANNFNFICVTHRNQFQRGFHVQFAHREGNRSLDTQTDRLLKRRGEANGCVWGDPVNCRTLSPLSVFFRCGHAIGRNG